VGEGGSGGQAGVKAAHQKGRGHRVWEAHRQLVALQQVWEGGCWVALLWPVLALEVFPRVETPGRMHRGLEGCPWAEL